MAFEVATITKLTGQAFVRNADGSLTPLREGSRIPADAEIVTRDASNVEMAIDGQQAPVVIGENRAVAVTGEMVQPTDSTDAAIAAPSADPLTTDSARLLAALEAGEDPFGIVEATAAIAGGPGGDDGGSSFVRLLRILEPTTPLDLAYPRPNRGEEELPRHSGYALDPGGPGIAADDVNGNGMLNGHNAIVEGAALPVIGTISVSAPAGLDNVTIGGVTLTEAQLLGLGTTPITINTPMGKLTLTGYDGTRITYEYAVEPGKGHDHSAGDSSVVDGIPLTITDDMGRTVGGELTIQILDTEPVANDDVNSVKEDVATGGDVKAEGNVLRPADGGNDVLGVDDTTVIGVVAGINTGLIENGNADGSTKIVGKYGELVINADGTYTYTLTKNGDPVIQSLREGQTLDDEVFSYTIRDADGDHDTALIKITITGTNDAPVAAADTGTVIEDGVHPGGNTEYAGELTATGNVLTNDRDIDNGDQDKLTVSGLKDSAPGANGSLVVQGKYGTLTLNPDGSYEYKLDPAKSNELSRNERFDEVFTYTVNDNSGTANATDESTLTITVIGTNDKPEISGVSNGGLKEDEVSVSGQLGVSDADKDGDEQTWSLRDPASPNTPATVVEGTYGRFIIDQTGKWTYELDNSKPATQALKEGEQVKETFTAVVTDKHGAYDEQPVEVTITGTNDAPELVTNLVPQKNDDADTIQPVDISKHFKDVDGDELTFAAKDLPPGLDIDPKTGIITGKIDNSASQGGNTPNKGEYEVTITVTDGKGGSIEKTFIWDVSNPEPEAVNDEGKTDEDTVLSVPKENGLLKNDSDPDGDDLTVTHVTGKDGNPVEVPQGGVTVPGSHGGTVTVYPDGSYEFNPGKDFQYLPDGEETTTRIKYQISDGEGGTAEAELIITVTGNNDAPVVTADVDSVRESGVKKVGGDGNVNDDGKPVATGNVLTNDTDVDQGTALKVGEVGNGTTTVAPGAEIQGKYGKLVINADGTYTYTLDNNNPDVQKLNPEDVNALKEEFTYTATDGTDSTESKLTINISGTNDRPVIDPTTTATGEVKEAGHNEAGTPEVSGKLVATDVDQSDVLTWSPKDAAPGTVIQGTYGSITINADGTWTYLIDNNLPATQKLNDGVDGTETFKAVVTDKWGATREQDITIAVKGTNDAIEAKDDTASVNEDGTVTGNVLSNDVNLDGGKEVSKYTFNGKEYNAGETADVPGLGKFVLNKDGSFSFSPAKDYSGEVPPIRYTAKETEAGGLTSEANLVITINPVADAPAFKLEDTQTLEDTRIALDLKAPAVTDNVDQNGAGKGDNPERLGLITLTGIPAGVKLLHGDDSEILVSNGQPIRICLTDGEHIAAPEGGWPAGTLYMTKTQYEALKVDPNAHDHKNFTVKVEVTSYEVDDGGKPLDGVDGATTTETVLVDVLAVTDPVWLGAKDGLKAGDKIGSDGEIVSVDRGDPALADDKISLKWTEDKNLNLGSLLKADFQDTDGSEQRWITVEGGPSLKGASIVIGGKTYTAVESPAGSGKYVITTPKFDGTQSAENFINSAQLKMPANYSGKIDGVKITLHAQDRDSDSTVTTAHEKSSVTVDLDLKPVADSLNVSGVTTTEDTAVSLFKNVSMVDKDGSEVVTKLVVDIPAGWVLERNGAAITDGSLVQQPDGSYKLTVPVGAGMNNAQLTDLLGQYKATPPAHSSEDATIKLEVSTKDTAAGHDDSTSTTSKQFVVKVTPVAEIVGKDSDGDGTPDLTMGKGHQYDGTTVAGNEDSWFNLNQGGYVLNQGWTNQDDASHGGKEQTYALLRAELLATSDNAPGDAAATLTGSKFQYSTDGGATWVDAEYVTSTFTKPDGTTGTVSGYKVPAEYLGHVRFMPPANVSGEFEIVAHAYTVDTDDNGTDTVSMASGEEKLTGIVVQPIADQATVSIKSPMHGEEDGAPVPLVIQPRSEDASETFNVEISGVPEGATLMYNGQPVAVDADGKALIENFDPNAPLTIQLGEHQSGKFDLQVKAQTVESDGSLGPWSPTLNIDVIVKGVADAAVIEAVDTPPTYAEADLDNGGTVALKDLLKPDVTMPDSDGSETLTYRVSGLPEGFNLKGGQFLGGTGAGREWVLTKEELDSIQITAPKNFNGEVTFQVTPVTTENDTHTPAPGIDAPAAGDAKVGQTVDVSFKVSPSPEATLNASSSLVEDVASKVDLSAVHQNGDTDEFVSEVWIKADEAETGDYTLYLGDPANGGVKLSEAGIANDGGYYKLNQEQLNNIYAKGGADKHGSFDLDVKYVVTDPGKDGMASTSSAPQDGKHTLNISPVTDDVELTLNGISQNGGVLDTSGEVPVFTSSNGGELMLSVKTQKAADEGTRDHDGSEHLTRIMISGVPAGVMVEGGQLLADGTWMIVTGDKITGQNGLDSAIKFIVSDRVGANASGGSQHSIKVEVWTEDANNEQVKSDEIVWIFDDQSAQGPGAGDEVGVDGWNVKDDVPVKEDGEFTLGDVLEGHITFTGSDPKDVGFTITLDVPEGTEVTGPGVSKTVIDGKTVWTVSGKGGDDALQDALNNVKVTPPANLNDNHGSFDVGATIQVYEPGGSQAKADDKDVVPVTPDTDNADISIVVDPNGVDEGQPIDVTIKLGTQGPDADKWEVVDGKLYIEVKPEAGLEGTLLDADGNPVPTEVKDGKTYYVLEGAKPGDEIKLSFKPDNEYKSGKIAVEVNASVRELNGGEPENSTVKGEVIVNAIDNGYDFQGSLEGSADSTGAEDSVVQLKLGGGLRDTDSEEVVSVIVKGLPKGWLLKTGDDAGSSSLAKNVGIDGDGNVIWSVPLVNGQIPSFIGAVPPENWSGTLDDKVSITINSREKGADTLRSDVKEFDVVVTPVADGIDINPTLSFGKGGELVDVRLNANMLDVDGSEKATLQFKGLDDDGFSQFYVNGKVLGSDQVSYDADTDTYTIEGLSHEDLNALQMRGTDVKESVQVKAWTVESDGSVSDAITKDINIDIGSSKAGTSGDDALYFKGVGLVDGGAGEDTVYLHLADTTGSQLGSSLKNIEVLDLNAPAATKIDNLRIEDVLNMTDGRNTLTIDGDSNDRVEFGQGWSTDGTKNADGYVTYTAEGSDVTVLVSDEVIRSIKPADNSGNP